MKPITRKVINVICIVVCIALLSVVLYFLCAFFGNPISGAIAKYNTKEFLAEKLADTDFEINKTGYNFKTGGYYSRIISPSSQDSYFTIYFDGWGKYSYDSYDNIGNKNNTLSRLDEQYRELTKSKLPDGESKFDTSIGYGELAVADLYEVFSYTDDDGVIHHYSLDKGYGLDRTTLELDKEYDIQQLGADHGRLILYIHDPEVSVERAAELLLEVKSYLDENNVPFHAVNFNLCVPRNENGQMVGDQINLYEFLYSDIYEEGLVERVQEHWDIAQEHHAIQDGLKNTLEKVEPISVLPFN